MVVGILRMVVEVPESQSLKDKRAVIRSLKTRIENNFRVAVAEVGAVGLHQQGELGIACVSNAPGHAHEILSHVADFAISNAGDGTVGRVETEIIHLG